MDGNLDETTPGQLARSIGRQRNSFGKAMGDVALANDSNVQDEIRRLLVAGFTSRGYSIEDVDSALLVANVDISKFWGWFRPGFASIGFETDIQCDVDINGDGVQQTVSVSGHGLNKGQVASDANWGLSFKRAIEDFLVNFDTAMERAGL